MIVGSFTSPLYYGFYCEEDRFWRNLWIGIVWFFNLIALVIVLSPGKISKWVNALTWVTASVSSTIGCIHLAYFPNKDTNFEFYLWPWAGFGSIYILGAFIYALKCPEKCFKKRFDIYGSSHQIFHFCILTAAILHFWASL